MLNWSKQLFPYYNSKYQNPKYFNILLKKKKKKITCSEEDTLLTENKDIKMVKQ